MCILFKKKNDVCGYTNDNFFYHKYTVEGYVKYPNINLAEKNSVRKLYFEKRILLEPCLI